MNKKIWKTGALHCHTLWSDGASLPETVLQIYRNKGFDFVCLADHNLMQHDPQFWMETKTVEGYWPCNLTNDEVDRCERLCGKAPEMKIAGFRRFVRLKTLDELKTLFEKNGDFLVVPGMEMTAFFRGIGNGRPQQYFCHMNTFNLDHEFPLPQGTNASEIVKNAFRNYRETAGKSEKSFFMLNHPFGRFWDIDPQTLLDNPEIRFFEVCNSGSDDDAPEYNPLTPDKYWDFVLAHRIDRNQDIIYATASDDAHFYDPDRSKGDCSPATGFVVVNCPGEFTGEAISEAMYRGDFYASSGVMLEDITFDKTAKKLFVKVNAQSGIKYRIRFITTRKNFDRTIKKKIFPDPRNGYDRDLTVIPENIGITVKCVENSEASCEMPEDALYIRAVVESDKPGRIHKKRLNYPAFECAWTQPYFLFS